MTQKRGFDLSPNPKVKFQKTSETQKLVDSKKSTVEVKSSSIPSYMKGTSTKSGAVQTRNTKPIERTPQFKKPTPVATRVNSRMNTSSLNGSMLKNNSLNSSVIKKQEEMNQLLEENESLKQKLYSIERREEELKNEVSRNYSIKKYQEEDRKRLEEMERKYRNLENDYYNIQKQKDRNENDLIEVKRELKAKDNELKIEIGSLKSQNEIEIKKMKEKYEMLIQEIKEENEKLIRQIQENHQKEIRNVQLNLNSVKIDLEYAVTDLNNGKNKIQELEKIIQQNNIYIKELEDKRLNDEMLRRKLHNTIQELKGNIRVYCRVRPLSKENQSNEFDHMKFSQDRNGTDCAIDLDAGLVSNATGEKTLAKKYSFQFDKVFKPDSTQSFIFEEISQLVQSALDGYKVCIFAYGQTGSGKTFTMEGDPSNIDNRGMIPRSVEKIFQTAESMENQGWKYTIVVSYLEIYNENINDLFIKKEKKDAKYEIKHEKGNTIISDLEYHEVKSLDKVFELLRIASKNRVVAYTNCNERSSRSHSVFSLQITGKNDSTQQTTHGILNLIDLAGSERLKESKSSGERLKETQSINSSLSYLGDVIHAIANKEKHIPFRNSKLTYYLQNYLGGDSKTLMFVNISPNLDCINETVNSLRFASKVNSCQIGTANKRVTSSK